LDHIFLYCSVKDKLNVACCNKAHCSLLKPWLWGCVAVPVFKLEELTQPLENLKHTSMLKIDGTCDEVYRDNWDFEDEWQAQAALKNSVEKGLLLAKILSYCNPSHVTSLETTAMDTIGLNYSLDVLCHINQLKLASFEGECGQKIKKYLLQLEELELVDCSEECVRSILKELVGGNNLMKLKINALSKKNLTFVNEFVCLRYLDLSPLDSQNSTYNFTTLTNLTCLGLHAKISTDALKGLCRSLTNLKKLDLSSSTFADEGLERISCLSSLLYLSLSHCKDITVTCLDYLVDPLPLKKLTISSDLTRAMTKKNFIPSVSNLNKLTSLKEVYVESHKNHPAEVILMKSLCGNGKWQLQYDIPKMNFIFTR